MRKVLILIGFIVALLVVCLYLFRIPTAELAVQRILMAQGFDAVSVKIKEIGPGSLKASAISAEHAGNEVLAIDEFSAEFDFKSLMRDGRVTALRIGPGELKARINERGEIFVAGRSLNRGTANKGPDGDQGLPFDALFVDKLTLDLETPEGTVLVNVDGSLTPSSAGALTLDAQSQRGGINDFYGEDIQVETTVSYSADGDFTIDANISGDMNSAFGTVSGVELDIEGRGSSWLDIVAGDFSAVVVSGFVDLQGASFNTETSSAFARVMQLPEILGGRPATISGSGSIDFAVRDGVVELATGDSSLSVRGDNDAYLSFDAMPGDPFFIWSQDETLFGGVLTLRGGDISAAASIDIAMSDGNWVFDIPVRFGDLETSNLELKNASVLLRGMHSGDELEIETLFSGIVTNARTGRFLLRDAPVEIHGFSTADLAAKVAHFQLPEDSCAHLSRAAFTIEGQDMAASLDDATLCAGSQPLVTVSWQNDPVVTFASDIAAKSARYRLGQTTMIGRPPQMAVQGHYSPVENTTRATARAADGDVRINDFVRMDRADAQLVFLLERNELSISGNAASVRVRENKKTPNVAPVFASGNFAMENDQVRFDYEARTPAGIVLGNGTGVHNLSQARGTAQFDVARLTFAPDGLQPDQLAPALKGNIGSSSGAIDGTVAFSWSVNGVISSAEIAMDDLSFNGPGLTVTRTSGVDGTIRFANLSPIETAGLQTLNLAGVDFGALQLENGAVIFALPGDERLLIESALFPWFGGEIGVREATASFDGGNAVMPMNVASVDLKQVLDYVDIDGLSGTGTLNGVLPVVIENGRANFVDGKLTAAGPGTLSYVGKAGEQAAAAGGDAKIAFDVLRDLEYESLTVSVDGPLDGRIDFQINFEGTGMVSVNGASGRVPVKYTVSLDAALLELLNQANLSRNLQMQIERAARSADQN